MDRRMLVRGGALACLWLPRSARAQQAGKVPVVGILNSGPPDARSLGILRHGLSELGYAEGQTIMLEVRATSGHPERLPSFAADLVQRKVDVLFAIGPAALKASADATRTIPIVAFDLETDPVQSGLARSLSRPGGNVTGLFLDLPGLTGKWLELIREAAPKTRRVAVLWDSTTGGWQLAAVKAAAGGIGWEVQVVEVRSSTDLDKALAGARRPRDPLVQLSSPTFEAHARQIAEFAVRYRLPAIALSARFTEAGGLMSYGPPRPEFGQRLAVFVDKILKGASAADIPIELPERFELVINLGAARAIGLALPRSLIDRADRTLP